MNPSKEPVEPVARHGHDGHVLVINPNTSASVTALLQSHVQQRVHVSAPGVQVRSVTARFGPAYISSELAYTIAAHATLDAWAAHGAQVQAERGLARDGLPVPDAVLIGCFGDPGLLALRELAPVPVTGLAEGAFTVAARHGRFGIVTGGERWKPMLQRLAQALGCDALAAIHTVSLTGAQLAADPGHARRVLAEACVDMHRTQDVQAIVLGGAALAGMAAEIQDQLPIPVIDSVHAATQCLLERLQQAQADDPDAQQRQAMAADAPVAWQGLSPELLAVLKGG